MYLIGVDLVSVLCSPPRRGREGVPMADLPEESWNTRVNISNGREIFVVPMLTVENVMRMLVCSRSSAYEHMNRALGRTQRPGRLLCVPLDVFESYVRHTLRLAAPRPAEAAVSARVSASPSRVAAPRASGAPAIRVAKPPRPRR
jgi:hypothetical protein